MISIRPTPRAEVEARWANVRSIEEEVRGPQPRPLNLDAIIDLGNIVFFTFRGRPFGVPPLPWREGEQILDAYLELEAFPDSLSREDLPRYYSALRRLQSALWRNTRSVGRIRRMVRRLGLVRNPFRKATERELIELAGFMLGRRMSSGGLHPMGPESLET